MPTTTIDISILSMLLLIASAVAIAVKWIRLPYSIALVLTGLAVGASHVLPKIEVTPHLILFVILPTLLFEASLNLDLKRLRSNWLPVLLMAFIGVLVSSVVVAIVTQHFGGLSMDVAFLFGTLISSTDPISVIALFRTMGIDGNLTMVLEGESLFNDGASVVLFNVAYMIATSKTGIDPGHAAVGLFVTIVGGLAIGALVGFAACKIVSFFDDHLVETMLTTLVAYGSYLLADHLHVSAVFAVVVAGMVVGSYGLSRYMTERTQFAVASIWEYAAFLANSLIFLLIGMQINLTLLGKYSHLITIGVVAILLARFIAVYGLCYLMSFLTEIPLRWRHLLFWGSLRGSLSMALALSLPDDFAAKQTLIVITFGTVLFTLLIQGLTVEPLAKLLKLHEAR